MVPGQLCGPGAKDPSYQQQDLAFVQALSSYYCSRTGLIGMSFNNEPTVRRAATSCTLSPQWLAVLPGVLAHFPRTRTGTGCYSGCVRVLCSSRCWQRRASHLLCAGLWLASH